METFEYLQDTRELFVPLIVAESLKICDARETSSLTVVVAESLLFLIFRGELEVPKGSRAET